MIMIGGSTQVQVQVKVLVAVTLLLIQSVSVYGRPMVRQIRSAHGKQQYTSESKTESECACESESECMTMIQKGSGLVWSGLATIGLVYGRSTSKHNYEYHTLHTTDTMPAKSLSLFIHDLYYTTYEYMVRVAGTGTLWHSYKHTSVCHTSMSASASQE